MKKNIIIGIAVILIAVTGAVMINGRVQIIRPGAIGMTKVDVDNNGIHVTGEVVLDSISVYKKYSYRIEENNIYITIYGGAGSSSDESGHIDLFIDGDFSEIEKIFLEGKGESVLIWQAERQNENTDINDMRIGKNITVEITDGENINSDYLRNVLNGTTVEPNPFFTMMEAQELEKLIEYMEENDYKIGSGVYTINQAWKFDDGEFVSRNGEKRDIFAFEKAVD